MTHLSDQFDKSAAVPAASSQSLDAWEAAYLRFETPEQEIQKFLRRLRALGAEAWPRDARILEIFCGRGNGLRALERLGFKNLEGADLSARLLAEYHGPAKCTECDCRKMPFAGGSKDVVIVQGGLHHLPNLPQSLDETLAEAKRVLANDGRMVIVEPWLTPFLSFVHFACGMRPARRLWPKLDAMAAMIKHERNTYEQWLSQPDLIRRSVMRHFAPVRESVGWGKWNFVGKSLGS
ncbi:MAG TPA: class I SAM-dependent methyltransferase [Candidatus Acidoferrales bacterium]|nr:class I SAM-dependent methyltransferase [Candidatus Acidoferrales bacterium]